MINKRKHTLRYYVHRLSTVLIVLCSVPVVGVSQGASEAQLKSSLSKFKNYRYGNISIFKLDDESMNGVTQLLNPEPIQPEASKKCSPAKQTQIDDKVQELGCAVDLTALQEDEEIKKVLRAECIDYAKYAVNRMQWQCNKFKKAYVVTMRYQTGAQPKLVALLTSNSESPRLPTILASPRDIITYTQLRQSGAPSGSPAKTLYEYLGNFVLQSSEAEGVNVTPEAQGLGDEVFWEKVYGLAAAVKEDDVAQYVRISEGQAMEYKAPRELIVSPDLISYRDYSLSDGSAPADSIYNRNLPKFGVELRHGNDAVNQPGFFSERVSLNALWGVNRLGIILPTNGLASLSSSFGIQRRMTYAGFGINAGFDFPWKVTNAGTGVFHISGSYVFDDAKQSSHQRSVQPQQTFSVIERRGADSIRVTRTNTLANDYLIRFNAQAHYSFAVGIDSGNFFRFRIGGGVYSREVWQADNGNTREETIRNGSVTRDTSFTKDNFTRFNTRFFGGISARVEYMSMYVSTPYGFSLQYFDETMMGEAWLLVPISTDVGLRFDGRLAAPILRDPYEWENQTLFVPSMRLIYNF
ncbi:MAG: hypothetical protein JNL32_05075 [Candidatus Kapabacteria bacterium]|nr:hypothetical protein [Candidatus Kapabacteria bacterium]